MYQLTRTFTELNTQRWPESFPAKNNNNNLDSVVLCVFVVNPTHFMWEVPFLSAEAAGHPILCKTYVGDPTFGCATCGRSRFLWRKLWEFPSSAQFMWEVPFLSAEAAGDPILCKTYAGGPTFFGASSGSSHSFQNICGRSHFLWRKLWEFPSVAKLMWEVPLLVEQALGVPIRCKTYVGGPTFGGASCGSSHPLQNLCGKSQFWWRKLREVPSVAKLI
ncbi:hypothetical protein C8R44DRAFT_748746 [Mycena epipterygia]|nr:hypothetical protein C8R44DRAFT_748746 [Mycena epipterygia]